MILLSAEIQTTHTLTIWSCKGGRWGACTFMTTNSADSLNLRSQTHEITLRQYKTCNPEHRRLMQSLLN